MHDNVENLLIEFTEGNNTLCLSNAKEQNL